MSDNEYFEIANNSKASWLCSNCLFPGQDSMSVDDIFCSYHSLNASPTQNLHPKIQLRRDFKIAHLNINRLLNSIDAVKKILCSYTFDVLAISKTWLSPEIEDSEILIEGCKVIRKDRQCNNKTMGGGVLIYIRQDISFRTLND